MLLHFTNLLIHMKVESFYISLRISPELTLGPIKRRELMRILNLFGNLPNYPFYLENLQYNGLLPEYALSVSMDLNVKLFCAGS